MIVNVIIQGMEEVLLESVQDHSEILKAIEEGRLFIQPSYVIRNGKKIIAKISLVQAGYLKIDEE